MNLPVGKMQDLGHGLEECWLSNDPMELFNVGILETPQTEQVPVARRERKVWSCRKAFTARG